MNDFVRFMTIIIDFMKRDYMIYGYPISFWDMFMWVCVAGIAVYIVATFMHS